MNNSNKMDNIFFLLEEIVDIDTQNAQDNIQKLVDDINTSVSSTDYLHYTTYTVKELLKICHYYDIVKNNRITKGKKQDLIAIIVWFENMAENAVIVRQRNKMWSHIAELNADEKMRKYLLWV